MRHEWLRAASLTGIGSLPHHNIDSALEYAFSFSIPFLPQIPIRNPWEYSIPQGLDGLPGLQVEKEGAVFLDSTVWTGRAHAFLSKLKAAFVNAQDKEAFSGFEPSNATSSSWQPFLWELQERKTRVAKIQLIGPLTAQWSLRLSDGSKLRGNEEVEPAIFRLILARALGMARRLKSQGVFPLLFLDEPALFVLSKENPKHLGGLTELKLMVQALQKDEVAVGLHCCSNTHWDVVLGLGLDFVSLDVALSLESLLEKKREVATYVEGGGRFALGLVPTSANIPLVSASDLMKSVKDIFAAHADPALATRILSEALWTPACGLALHTPKDAQTVLSLLKGALS